MVVRCEAIRVMVLLVVVVGLSGGMKCTFIVQVPLMHSGVINRWLLVVVVSAAVVVVVVVGVVVGVVGVVVWG
jgi:hypothetical protein